MGSPARKAGSFVLLLWALLVSAQTLAVVHEHTDDVSDAAEQVCAACSLAQAQTAAWDGHGLTIAPALRSTPVIPAARHDGVSGFRLIHRSRGPPRAGP